MGNPLDAFRITVLFNVEQAAFAGLDAGALVRWWLAHGWLWLTLLLLVWTAGSFVIGLVGARRRLDA